MIPPDTKDEKKSLREPPKVLITPAMVQQMREKQRQLKALRQMIADREARSDGQ